MGEQDTLETDSRRKFLKKAALGGSAAVWAPPVIDSLAAPAFAMGSPMQTQGCGRAQYHFDTSLLSYNLIECFNVKATPAQADTTNTGYWNPVPGKVTGGARDSNSENTNRNCCSLKSVSADNVGCTLDCVGTDLAWEKACDAADYPNADVTSILTVEVDGVIDGAIPATGLATNKEMSLIVDPAVNCAIADITIWWAKPTLPTGIGDCNNLSFGSANFTSSDWWTRFNFKVSDGPVWPIYMKLWVGCDLVWGSGSGTTCPPPGDNGNIWTTQCVRTVGAPADILLSK